MEKWKGRGEDRCQGSWNILGSHFIKRQSSLNGTSVYLRMKRKKAQGEVIRQAEGDLKACGVCVCEGAGQERRPVVSGSSCTGFKYNSLLLDIFSIH